MSKPICVLAVAAKPEAVTKISSVPPLLLNDPNAGNPPWKLMTGVTCHIGELMAPFTNKPGRGGRIQPRPHIDGLIKSEVVARPVVRQHRHRLSVIIRTDQIGLAIAVDV